MTDLKSLSDLDEMLGVTADRLALPEDEGNLSLDGTMGTYIFWEDSVRPLTKGVEDLEPIYFEKRGVDRGSLLARLSKLDGLSRLALVSRLDRLRS